MAKKAPEKTAKAAGNAGKEVKTASKQDQKNIAARAYEIYCERKEKGIPGTSQSDWEQAEEEFRGR